MSYPNDPGDVFPSDSPEDVPRLADQVLYAEYLQLANELSGQGIQPDIYHENPLLQGARQGLAALFTWRRKHNFWSVLAAVVGCLVTAIAFNKVLSPVLPLALRGPLSLPVAIGTAAFFVWGTVKVFVVLYTTYSLGTKFQGMFDALECLEGERARVRRAALAPLRSDLRRYGPVTWIVLALLGLGMGAVDVGALFNLLSEYLSGDSPLPAVLATFGASLFTLAIILGKAVYEGHFYYVPTALDAYGQMYRRMAKEQFLINQGLLPARIYEERRQHNQQLDALHHDLQTIKQANADLQQQLTRQHEQFDQEHDKIQLAHQQELEKLLAAVHQVISGHSNYSQLVERMHRLAGSPPPALLQPLEHNTFTRSYEN
jgi:hypothetical protein